MVSSRRAPRVLALATHPGVGSIFQLPDKGSPYTSMLSNAKTSFELTKGSKSLLSGARAHAHARNHIRSHQSNLAHTHTHSRSHPSNSDRAYTRTSTFTTGRNKASQRPVAHAFAHKHSRSHQGNSYRTRRRALTFTAGRIKATQTLRCELEALK